MVRRQGHACSGSSHCSSNLCSGGEVSCTTRCPPCPSSSSDMDNMARSSQCHPCYSSPMIGFPAPPGAPPAPPDPVPCSSWCPPPPRPPDPVKWWFDPASAPAAPSDPVTRWRYVEHLHLPTSYCFIDLVLYTILILLDFTIQCCNYPTAYVAP
jgi:hypothetical protein